MTSPATPTISATAAGTRPTPPTLRSTIAVRCRDNILTANQGSLDDATVEGYVPVVNCELRVTNDPTLNGDWSLLMTSAGPGNMMAAAVGGATRTPVAPGQSVAAVAHFRATTTGRPCVVYLQFVDHANIEISRAASAPLLDVTTGWVPPIVIAVAPPLTSYVQVLVEVQGITSTSPNMLTAQQADLEDGTTTGWVVGEPGIPVSGASTAIANTGAEALHGTRSLRLTNSSGGSATIAASTTPIPCQASTQYVFLASVRAVSTPRSGLVDAIFFDSGMTFISAFSGGFGPDSASSWLQGNTAPSNTSPPGAAFAVLGVRLLSVAAGESHDVDCIGIMQGTTTTWTEPAVAVESHAVNEVGVFPSLGPNRVYDSDLVEALKPTPSWAQTIVAAPSGNQLSAASASFEDGTVGGWIAGSPAFSGTATGLSNTTAEAVDGTHSLRLTNTSGASATLVGTTPLVPYNTALVYTALASIRAASTPRSGHIDFLFYDAARTYISGVDAPWAFGDDSSSAWNQADVSLSPGPPSAAYLAISVRIDSVAAGESHYVDCVSIAQGTSSTWTPGVGGSWTVQNGVLTQGNRWLWTVGTTGAQGADRVVSQPIGVTPGATMDVSAYIDAAAVSSGSPRVAIYDNAVTTTYATASQTAGVRGVVSSSFVVPGGVTVVRVALEVHNCTMTAATQLGLSLPQLVPGGSAPAYTPGPTWTPGGLDPCYATVEFSDDAGVSWQVLPSGSALPVPRPLQTLTTFDYTRDVVAGAEVRWYRASVSSPLAP